MHQKTNKTYETKREQYKDRHAASNIAICRELQALRNLDNINEKNMKRFHPVK